MFGATSEPEPFYPVSNPKHPTSSFRSEKMPGAILRISFYNSPISSVAPFPLSTKTGTKIIPSFHLFLPSSSPLFTISSPCTAAIQKSSRTYQTSTFCTSYEIGGGFSDNDVGGYDNEQAENIWDSATYEALLSGGEQVTSVLQEMIGLLEDMNMDETSEAGVVELVAQGVIGKRVDEMEFGFMLALDYMIQRAEKDNDDQCKTLLEEVKETVLSHLAKRCPPHVQVIGLLCQTPQKESRHELLRRIAAGGGVFGNEKSTKVHLPGANLNDIVNQADDLLETMEARPTIPDRKLLARLVLIREEARNMMGGGILDERNDRGLSTLPEAEVNFLTKLVALRPGETVKKMIANVMQGRDEGADRLDKDDNDATRGRGASSGIAGRASVSGRKPRPVRPGMFLETVCKVLGGIYAGNVSGITAQHLEWVHEKTLQVLQEMAY